MVSKHITLITSSTTLDTGFDSALVDASAGNITITFPVILGDGTSLDIKRIDTNSANTLTLSSVDTFEGSSTVVLNPRDLRIFVSFNGQWYIYNI